MKVGKIWRGGIYAGITHNNLNLILNKRQWDDRPYKEAANLASGYWRLPTRKEGALLYANLQHLFKPVWYWTCEMYPPDDLCHWVQTFGYGRQADLRDTDGANVCLVRAIPCD